MTQISDLMDRGEQSIRPPRTSPSNTIATNVRTIATLEQDVLARLGRMDGERFEPSCAKARWICVGLVARWSRCGRSAPSAWSRSGSPDRIFHLLQEADTSHATNASG